MIFRGQNKSKYLKIIHILALAIIAIVFLTSVWDYCVNTTEKEAVQFALAAETGFQKSSIAKFKADSSDADLVEYKEFKSSLLNLAKQNNKIKFAYIYTQKNNKMYFIADSEPVDSELYSPPGQEFYEANNETFLPYENGQTVLTHPITDRWGTWISVLVPMKDMETGEVIAVFGVDYPEETWYNYAISHTLYSGIACIFLFSFIVAFYFVILKNKELKTEKLKIQELDAKLEQSEMQFREIFNQLPVGVAIGKKHNQNISSVFEPDSELIINPIFEKITGRTRAELVNTAWINVTHPDDLQKELEIFEKFKSGEISGYDIEKRYIKPDGSVIWLHLIVGSLKFNDSENDLQLSLVEDITYSKNMEEALNESKQSKSIFYDNFPGLAYRCKNDNCWTMLDVSKGCFELTGYNAKSLLNNYELSFNDLIVPKYRELLANEWSRALELKERFKYEYEIVTATGQQKWVLEVGQAIYDINGCVKELDGIIIDITDAKHNSLKIQYINDHDILTGVYNRKYFETGKLQMGEEKNLPLAIIVGDINGVRVINSAFGFSEGDKIIVKTAKIIESFCSDDDLLARTGGDEFTIMMPNTEEYEANEIIERIETTCEKYNKTIAEKAMNINLSIGYSIKRTNNESMEDLISKAEENMNKRKLLKRSSYYSSIITSIMATMYEKSQETEEHAKRLAEISKLIGAKLSLSKKETEELELLAMLHDVGKIGIDDSILNKPGKLTKDEWDIMKKHPDIGYRIAMSTNELQPIAEYILTHHERWDGNGYPKGLSGENIPLLSRILAVVDTYDAITEDRVYRKGMPKEIALEEIRRNSGTQFDPLIVEIFMNII